MKEHSIFQHGQEKTLNKCEYNTEEYTNDQLGRLEAFVKGMHVLVTLVYWPMPERSQINIIMPHKPVASGLSLIGTQIEGGTLVLTMTE